jgi:hypothetical protein
MTSDAPSETFAFRTSHGSWGSKLFGLGCIAIPAIVAVTIGGVVAATVGEGGIRRGFWIASTAALLPGLALASRMWWKSRVTLRDSGGSVWAAYGPGGVFAWSRRFDKHAGVAVETGGGHGSYPLTLVQGGVSIGLGYTKDVFPDPYVALVAWLRERGVHVIERWEYPQPPKVRPVD